MTNKGVPVVLVDGHVVDSRRLDDFYNGEDGSRVTDSQWDEMKRRMDNDPDTIDLKALGFEYVGIEIPDGDEFGGTE